MRNYEIIKQIYDRCPSLESFQSGGDKELSTSQVFDRCLDIRAMIERERPEIAKRNKRSRASR